jgi:hypothetical protein
MIKIEVYCINTTKTLSVIYEKGKKYIAKKEKEDEDISYYIQHPSLVNNDNQTGRRFWVKSAYEEWNKPENQFYNYFELLIDNRKRKLNKNGL